MSPYSWIQKDFRFHRPLELWASRPCISRGPEHKVKSTLSKFFSKIILTVITIHPIRSCRFVGYSSWLRAHYFWFTAPAELLSCSVSSSGSQLSKVQVTLSSSAFRILYVPILWSQTTRPNSLPTTAVHASFNRTKCYILFCYCCCPSFSHFCTFACCSLISSSPNVPYLCLLQIPNPFPHPSLKAPVSTFCLELH